MVLPTEGGGLVTNYSDQCFHVGTPCRGAWKPDRRLALAGARSGRHNTRYDKDLLSIDKPGPRLPL